MGHPEHEHCRGNFLFPLQKSGAKDAHPPNEHNDIGRMTKVIRNARENDRDERDSAGSTRPEKVR